MMVVILSNGAKVAAATLPHLRASDNPQPGDSVQPSICFIRTSFNSTSVSPSGYGNATGAKKANFNIDISIKSHCGCPNQRN
jgi:hypothetical protein